MGARWYDPVLARWTSPDSIVPDFTNPQSLNRYAYVYNNPLGYIDPDGHIPLPILLIFLAGVALTVNASTPLPPERAPSTEQGVLGIMMMLLPAATWAAPTATAGAAGAACLDGDCTNEAQTATTALCGSDGCSTAVRTTAQVATDLTGNLTSSQPGAATADAVNRALTAADFGLEGTVYDLQGTLSVTEGVATVQIDMVRASVDNPFAMLSNLGNRVAGMGAHTLRIQASIANDRLYQILSRRYELVTIGGVDYIEIVLEGVE